MSDFKDAEMVQIETPRQIEGVAAGNVLATMMREYATLCSELRARREFDEDVSEWLRDKPESRAAFEAFRNAKRPELTR